MMGTPMGLDLHLNINIINSNKNLRNKIWLN